MPDQASLSGRRATKTPYKNEHRSLSPSHVSPMTKWLQRRDLLNKHEHQCSSITPTASSGYCWEHPSTLPR
jgi:hypothetical protein